MSTIKDISDQVLATSLTPSTPEQIDAARRYVCAEAKDADEARMFLSMLGIEP